MRPLSFRTLPSTPDSTSPDGGTQTRRILTAPGGELAHVICRHGTTSGTHHLPDADRAFLVLGGSGEIWRADEERASVTVLRPHRWVAMPAGMRFRYRAELATSLVFLEVGLPSQAAGTVADGRPGTEETGAEEADRDDAWLAGDLPPEPDYLAPDGSEIRLLADFPRGGLAHCALPPGSVSSPVAHKTVHEIWFVLAGLGELWRSPPDGGDEVVVLWPGASIDIPVGTAFQFRSTGAEALQVAILTTPRWPGPDEAVPRDRGPWTP